MNGKPAGRSVCCIGGMTLERTLILQTPAVPGSSNPVIVRQGRGGVARNVAEYLARLSVPCRLLAMVGDDEDGRAIVRETSEQGVDTGLVQKSLSRPTGSFTAAIQPDGELFAGFADMEICESMDRGFIQNRWIQIGNATLIFADTSLPADSLAFLIAGCREHGLTLVVDAVSTAIGRKLPLNLHGVDMLICNEDEARAILGDEVAKDPETMATSLCQRGATSTVVTAGAGGLCFANADGCLALQPETTGAIDIIGSGDALIAGTLYGRLMNRDPVTSLRIGLKAAAIAAALPTDGNRPEFSAGAVTAGLD